MNIDSLTKVIELSDKLNRAISCHNANMQLTDKKGGQFGLPPRAYIRIGGDSYGNGAIHTIEIEILNSPELVRECRKIQSKSWSEVVSLRSALRLLGVNPDGAI